MVKMEVSHSNSESFSGWLQSLLNQTMSVLTSYKNQLGNLHWKSSNWFLCESNIALILVKPFICIILKQFETGLVIRNFSERMNLTQNEPETEHEDTVRRVQLWCHKLDQKAGFRGHKTVFNLKITHQWCE